MTTTNVKQRADLLDNSRPLRRASDSHTTPAPELKQPLIPKHAQRSQHRVRVHTKLSRKILRWRQPLAGLRLALENRTPYRRRDLIKHSPRIRAIHPHSPHPRIAKPAAWPVGGNHTDTPTVPDITLT